MNDYLNMLDSDWFWLLMVVGFFMQFTQPPPKLVAKGRKVAKPKRRNSKAVVPKRTPPPKAKAKKPKKVKPQKLSPDQEIQLGLYFAKRDGIIFSQSNIPE